VVTTVWFMDAPTMGLSLLSVSVIVRLLCLLHSQFTFRFVYLCVYLSFPKEKNLGKLVVLEKGTGETYTV